MSAPVSTFLPLTVSLPRWTFTNVRAFDLTAALDEIPELTVEVLSHGLEVDPEELLGRPVVASFEDAVVPRFDGVVRRAEHRSVEDSGVAVVALTIVPRLWMLTQRRGHRIFQDGTVIDVAEAVLAEHGAAMERPLVTGLAEALPVHEYRVQYGETDEELLFRLLAEEGLTSMWSADEEGRWRWTVTGDTSVGEVELEVPYRPAGGALGTGGLAGSALAGVGPHVLSAAAVAEICASEVRLRDFDPRKPAFPLEGRSLSFETSEGEDPLVRYTFETGQFDDERGGQRLSWMRLEQARSRRRVFRWHTSFPARPGMKVRLVDHPRDDHNGTFVVVASRSRADTSRRSHVLEVIPVGVRWRPPLRPRARVHGTQTAFVVGAPGQEIDVDAEGRIAVRFHWDLRPAGRSRRVRIATPWAGRGRGFWTLPRVGDEVVIAYLDGDPDQPLVVGSVHNGAAPQAAAMPRFQTMSWWHSASTPGGDGHNAIWMDDARGQESLALYAERDFFCRAGRRSTTVVEEDQVVEVHGNQTTTVGGSRTHRGGDVTTTIAGDYALIAGKFGLRTVGDARFECGGSRTDEAAAFHSISAETLTLVGRTVAALAGSNILITAAGDAPTITLQVGGSSIEMGPDKITIQAALIELNP